MNSIRNLYARYKVIFDNILFVSLIQLFGLLAPLITYPYLVDVLGMELYGLVITAQILVGYMVLVIDFGSNSVCAKNVSIHREDKQKLSEIVSSVLLIRLKLWLICLFAYVLLVFIIPTYNEYKTLFLFSYLLTLNELIFPQFYFQGIEKMKVVAFLNILVKLVFISLVFFLVKEKGDYLLVPVLYGIGYLIASIISLLLIFMKDKIRFMITDYRTQYNYLKECSPILATDMVCTVKDKLNQVLVGLFVSMGDVVIYDLALKLMGIMQKPSNIITTVLLPRFSKNKNVMTLKYVMVFVFFLSLFLVLIVNLFLPWIVKLFLHSEIDLLPLIMFSIVPIFLSVSIVIGNNFFIGFGYNKYVLYSIIITSTFYLFALFVVWILGYIHSLYSFVFIAIISYLIVLLYRLFVFYRKTIY